MTWLTIFLACLVIFIFLMGMWMLAGGTNEESEEKRWEREERERDE
jgi:hypothetical protein